MRSRAVFLPRACCFSTARSDPALATSATRRLRSASLPAVVVRSGAGDACDASCVRALVGCSSRLIGCHGRTLALSPCVSRSTRDIVRAALVTSGQPWRRIEFHPALGSTNTVLASSSRPPRRASAAPAPANAVRPGAPESPLWASSSPTTRRVAADASGGLGGARPRLDRGRGRGARHRCRPGRWMPLLAGLALARAVREVSGAGRAASSRPRSSGPTTCSSPTTATAR